MKFEVEIDLEHEIFEALPCDDEVARVLRRLAHEVELYQAVRALDKEIPLKDADCNVVGRAWVEK
jgi:hypothetical protein